ncbi:MAG TPA: hypothetical protein VFQ22_02305 [Longimicrobiales bacterium]|nr:hypothetical protein [Longimicrobiales bacterium]
MHLLLTDRLTCPRCGPELGLILLADRVEDRVVYEGVLGCSNCRDSFPVVAGFADLRAPPRGPLGAGLAGGPDEPVEGPERLLALLGVVGGPGTVALVGEPARHAPAVAGALGEIQVAAVDADLRGWPESPRVSRLAAAPGLPFFGSVLRAVAVDGRLGPDALTEAVRVAAPRARIVVVHAPDGTAERLRGFGAMVLASEAGTVVATKG